ncbi:MAG TPA: hypothetical protein VHB73_00985 [Alphaproteobacteria bacterium]|nr:hypothetical protein [Alphaproteobacteria bacterium]
MKTISTSRVMPAARPPKPWRRRKAGIHEKLNGAACGLPWIPTFVGMTLLFGFCSPQIQAAELRVDDGVCQQVIKYVQPPGVKYRPGVDVNGNRVAPADINPSPLNKQLEKQIAIKVFNDTARVFRLATPRRRGVPLAETETEIGYITLYKGQAYLNGVPLSNDQQDQLAVLCNQQKKQ